MSHIAVIRSTLKGVDQATVQAAFAALLQQHAAQGWQSTNIVYDYTMGNPTSCLAGVITRNGTGNGHFPYGVGVNVNAKGELEYVGDLSMQPWQPLKQELENYYVALGYASLGETTLEVHDAVQPTDVQIEMEIQF